MLFKKIISVIKEVSEYDRLVDSKQSSSFKSKLTLQLIIAFGFFLLSVANIIAKSYTMLAMTAFGFVSNFLFALLTYKQKNQKISSVSSIITCYLLFAWFVIYGGNNGFACLWVILLPLLSMIIIDFKLGLYTSLFFQFFLIVVFWTPLNEKLLYQYDTQFRLRFPLFFLLTFILGLLITISLRHAEYNEYKYMIELEKMNQKTLLLSRIDPLTKLANRRYSYEKFDSQYSENGIQHCIVMGDIDNFKSINDRYGHEFGDNVLVTISKYITETLPDNYLKSRWGGEEFLLAANASLEEVYEQVEKLRKTISEHPFVFDSSEIRITMTFGIAGYKNKDEISEAINLADKRLYAGKRMNKNCTVMQDN